MIRTVIRPRPRDLGSFSVLRVLPAAVQRSMGPFVFVDHIGPAVLGAGQGIDVRPHPHIGLATVTYLWDGALTHRDSLGSEQVIRPGDVNWMTAGRGIVHSERTPAPERAAGHRMHGMQTWVALPFEESETAPAFFHHPAATLPVIARAGVRVTVVAGTAFGERSPVRVFSPTLYAALEFDPDAELALDDEHAERALYVAAGGIAIGDKNFEGGTLVVFNSETTPVLRAERETRAMLLGGAPLAGERILWWNFVASSRERLERAKADWAEQRLGQVPGETEFIPLPSH
jgi:redox-sensitive bicupin YhaK (pirin superfamily)